jgi:hypothetical protein
MATITQVMAASVPILDFPGVVGATATAVTIVLDRGQISLAGAPDAPGGPSTGRPLVNGRTIVSGWG